MKIYLVGGAVRDKLLGLPLKDRDWVVVGASAEDMVRAGFIPVGRDFPVFLHPQTKEEYALARTEKKVSVGYAGFQFYADKSVTLEDDLKRRDLTINAMAEDEFGRIIDPFGGQQDLKNGVLRHVSSAFCEDGVRILRVARFAARFGFRVHDSTIRLAQEMVDELDSLQPERIWREFSRAITEKYPSLLFQVLREISLLHKIWPESFDKEIDCSTWGDNYDIDVRMAILALKTMSLPKFMALPKDTLRLMNLCLNFAPKMVCARKMLAQEILHIIYATDAIRRRATFVKMLQALMITSKEFTKYEMAFWLEIVNSLLSIPAQEIIERNHKDTLKTAFHNARLQAIDKVLIKCCGGV